MGLVIERENFKDIKNLLETYNDVARVANHYGVSKTTVRRVKKAKSYAGYKRILISERGPKYATRKAKASKSKTQTLPPVTAQSAELKKKKGIVRSMLEFFDISTAR